MTEWPQLAERRVHVWWIDLEPTGGEFPDCLRPERDGFGCRILSDDELVKAKRFVTPPLRLRYSAAHVAMRCILGRYLEIAPKAVPISVEDTGRPVIDFEQSPSVAPLFFNLSHSSTKALVALSNTRPVGVDVEQVREMSSRTGIQRQVYTDQEIDRLQNASDAQWFAYWTAKEAVLKATGYGFQLSPRLVELDPSLLSAVVSKDSQKSQWYLQPCRTGEQWSATVACSEPIAGVDQFDWQWNARCFSH